ncbi:MAG: hypothetical protein ACTHMS_20280 [Jatrophihabitans sp.]|uniref:hypothetical protein n=1 Tax=Jatrophihabitans sp. TaxID=1932789 RepID=UPI003F80D7B5
MEWNAEVVFDFEMPGEVVDEMLTRLNLPVGEAGLSNGAVIAAAPEGRTTVVVTVDADDLANAAVEAVRVTREIVDKDAVVLEVMPSAEYWAHD